MVIIIFAVVLAIVIGLQFFNKPGENQSPQTATLSEVVPQISYLKTQTNNEGAVEITVTPKNLSNKEWVFDIALNTHSMEIGEDLTKVSVLVDEDGNEYKPIEWQGDPPGGHHRKGILKFAPISPQPQSIILKIFQVGEIKERNFTWQL